MRFLKCDKCGNIVTYLDEKKCIPNCCGQEMTELIPGAVDGALEKHVPAVTIEGDKVTVQIGEVIHPMEEAHHIQFIAVETDQGAHIKYLKPGEEPKAAFTLPGEKVKAVYEYCNLHGLWVKEV